MEAIVLILLVSFFRFCFLKHTKESVSLENQVIFKESKGIISLLDFCGFFFLLVAALGVFQRDKMDEIMMVLIFGILSILMFIYSYVLDKIKISYSYDDKKFIVTKLKESKEYFLMEIKSYSNNMNGTKIFMNNNESFSIDCSMSNYNELKFILMSDQEIKKKEKTNE